MPNEFGAILCDEASAAMQEQMFLSRFPYTIYHETAILKTIVDNEITFDKVRLRLASRKEREEMRPTRMWFSNLLAHTERAASENVLIELFK